MAVYGLLSTPPSVTPNAATNRQFLDQYLREYDRLERDWMSRMQPVQYPAGRPYTPGPFSQITPPAPTELAPPPSAFAPMAGDGGPGGMPGGPMGSIDRNPGNAFGASPIGRGVGIGLTAASMLGGPIGFGAGALGFGMAANNIAANQAMRDAYGLPAMSFGQQLGGLFGGGLLGALGIGNASGLGLTLEAAPAQLAYGTGIDKSMDVGPVVDAAPVGSGLAGAFGGLGEGRAPGDIGGSIGAPAGFSAGTGQQDPTGAW
jgi:hypothetical protein